MFFHVFWHVHDLNEQAFLTADSPAQRFSFGATIAVMRLAPCLGTGLLAVLLAGAVAPALRASSNAEAAAGAQLFSTTGCTQCHGDNAQGGAIGPSLLDVGRRLKLEEILKQIHDGGGAMPAFGDALTSDQIGQLVAYLRTMRAKTPKVAGKPAM